MEIPPSPSSNKKGRMPTITLIDQILFLIFFLSHHLNSKFGYKSYIFFTRFPRITWLCTIKCKNINIIITYLVCYWSTSISIAQRKCLFVSITIRLLFLTNTAYRFQLVLIYLNYRVYFDIKPRKCCLNICLNLFVLSIVLSIAVF